jgi:hypothetical protein
VGRHCAKQNNASGAWAIGTAFRFIRSVVRCTTRIVVQSSACIAIITALSENEHLDVHLSVSCAVRIEIIRILIMRFGVRQSHCNGRALFTPRVKQRCLSDCPRRSRYF